MGTCQRRSTPHFDPVSPLIGACQRGRHANDDDERKKSWQPHLSAASLRRKTGVLLKWEQKLEANRLRAILQPAIVCDVSKFIELRVFVGTFQAVLRSKSKHEINAPDISRECLSAAGDAQHTRIRYGQTERWNLLLTSAPRRR
jgi:hypothetical protein